MRKLSILAACLASFSLVTAVVADEVAMLEDDTQGVRAEAVLDTDTAIDDTVAFEIGYTAFYDPNYELALLLLIQDDQDVERQNLALSIEQNFPFGWPVVPYLGAAAGYGWIDTNDDNPEEEGIMARATGGVKLFLRPNIAINAAALYSASLTNDQIFLDDTRTGLNDKNLEYAFGLRVYF